MFTDTNLGELRAPVETPVGTCTNCKGMRWVKHYWPPYGKHTQHDERCQRKYGYCIRLCTMCASGLKAGQITPQLYTWLGENAGDLPYKTLADFNRMYQAKAYDAVDAWLQQALANAADLKNVILAGSPGTGKTHLVAAIANALQAANIAVLFAVVPTFFDVYYAASFEEKHTLMRRASEIAVLVLDDLDKLHVPTATDGAYQKKTLFEMLNARYNAHKPTLITTNAKDGLKAWLDEATISRLVGRGTLLPMNGADYRQRKDGMR
jgi:DNA replication protein DnaC